MGDLEKYYHSPNGLPFLIKVAILHSYFETIHPFNDGNGRIGRLLITFWLCEKKLLTRPLLYLSLFLKEHRSIYYELLMKVRLKGDWNEWICFFLRGVRETAIEAIQTTEKLMDCIKTHKKIINEEMRKFMYAHKVYEILLKHPIISLSDISRKCKISYPTVQRTLLAFQGKKIISVKNISRATLAQLDRYIEILKKGTDNI